MCVWVYRYKIMRNIGNSFIRLGQFQASLRHCCCSSRSAAHCSGWCVHRRMRFSRTSTSWIRRRSRSRASTSLCTFRCLPPPQPPLGLTLVSGGGLQLLLRSWRPRQDEEGLPADAGRAGRSRPRGGGRGRRNEGECISPASLPLTSFID